MHYQLMCFIFQVSTHRMWWQAGAPARWERKTFLQWRCRQAHSYIPRGQSKCLQKELPEPDLQNKHTDAVWEAITSVWIVLINNNPNGYFTPQLFGHLRAETYYMSEQSGILYWMPAKLLSGPLTWNHSHCRSQDSMSTGDGGRDEEGDDEDSSCPGVVTAVDLANSHRHWHEQLKEHNCRCTTKYYCTP